MNIKYYSVVWLILLTAYKVHGECCGKTHIEFLNMIPGRDCSYYGGGSIYKSLVCSNFVCGNGEPPREGVYCGVGSCNMFGCNCDRGCIQGNPLLRFQEKNGEDVKRVDHF